ncbi:MAG: hypothetical protein HBSAPP02_02980 [Phycisphaerae bacterium]|nr:MAG: cytoplasmic protein [Planctomycetia bacterium]RIK69823.1 MAG: cytoplasmic protein [Planctomycetota bacterium]GJQ25266.1 MAG: hypothetical protein HBSAPP02_02980 [Phycisphaerae bacterium]
MPDEFISEPITPDAGTFDTAAMATGAPGLPTGFTWREEHHHITEVLSTWKVSEAEDHARGELYYRKQFWKVRTDRGLVATVYAVRKVKRGESPRKRWWLYTIHHD